MSERETEFKYLLDLPGYESLLGVLGRPRRARTFRNRYFVCRPLPERKDWVLRLRLGPEGNTLTLKIGREVSPGLFDSVEHSVSGVEEDPDSWLHSEPLRVFREEISSQPLEVQGESLTERGVFEAPIAVGEVWELDRCRLPSGREFHELEIELTASQSGEAEAAREQLEQWLREQGIKVSRSRKTKYARFLEDLGSI